jgi:hypothetical protein
MPDAPEKKTIVRVTGQAITSKSLIQAKYGIPGDISREVAEATESESRLRSDVRAEIRRPGLGMNDYLAIYAMFGEYEVTVTFSDGSVETTRFKVTMVVDD